MINNLSILKQDLIQIGNISTFLVDIPKLHPDNPKYSKIWNEYTKYCVEGLWGYDNGGYRFMPPTLFFYGNFFRILHVDTASKVRRIIKPKVRDIDWKIHYAFIEAQGFSGFKNDKNYTCDYIVLNKEKYEDLKYSKKEEDVNRYLETVDDNGNTKKFVSPRQYLAMLHESNLGRPLYMNPAKNLMIFGTRGGGKSYTVAGITAHLLTFDGIKAFTQKEFDDPPTVDICIGASNTDPSSELIAKVVAGLNAFSTDKELGVWGDITDEDYTPNPFSRSWVGTTNPGNKKNPFRYSYDVQVNGDWHTKGTQTKLLHVNYSDKKQGGSQAAAGGRYVLCVYEEVGLMPNFRDALLSNIATASGEGEQFGVQMALGTSGNIDLVQQTKMVFNNPDEYNFLEFDNIWEEDKTKIGLFIPAYLSDTKFKDENGNTDIEKALKHYVERREKEMAKNDPNAIYNEKMNYPLVPSDMWVSNRGFYFPVLECIERERELIRNNLYKTIGKAVDLIWDSKQPYGVRADLSQDAEPFYEFPYNRSMTKLDGAIMIYEEPNYVKGEIPNDMYIFTLDPYVAENIDEGESLGVLQGWLNPKYTKEGFNGNFLVCSYIGKHRNGKDAFYENCEKILAYYGNPKRGLWYEANRGDSVRGFFIRKNKTHLLALRPNRERGTRGQEQRVIDFGVMISNNIDKLDMIGDTSEWLLSKTMYNGKEVRVVETLPCIFLIRQYINFNMERYSNFDAVSASIIYPLALKEIEHKNIYEQEKKQKHNPIAFLSVNKNVFNLNGKQYR